MDINTDGYVTHNSVFIGQFKDKSNGICSIVIDNVDYDPKGFIIDITNLSKKLFSLGYKSVELNYYIYLFKYLEKEFLEKGIHPLFVNGWIPHRSSQEKRAFIVDILTRRRSGSADFGDILDHYNIPDIDDLFASDKWIKYSPRQIMTANQQQPDSYISNILDIAYPISKRPPTSMSAIVRSLKSLKTIQLNQPNTTGRPIAMEMIRDGKKVLEHLIPVTRYSYDVSKGAYFDKDKKQDYCGTFYYWEPSSNIYLIMGKSAYYPSKIIALYELEPENEVLDEVIENFIIKAERNGLVDKNLDYVEKYQEMINMLSADNKISSNIYGFDNFFDDVDKGDYIGGIFYAMEDDLDQPLCIAARKAGLDTLIFSRMPSIRRVVTELLDTRSREESINNLAWELN